MKSFGETSQWELRFSYGFKCFFFIEQVEIETNGSRLRVLEEILRKAEGREWKVEERVAGIKIHKTWSFTIVYSATQGGDAHNLSLMRQNYEAGRRRGGPFSATIIFFFLVQKRKRINSILNNNTIFLDY